MSVFLVFLVRGIGLGLLSSFFVSFVSFVSFASLVSLVNFALLSPSEAAEDPPEQSPFFG